MRRQIDLIFAVLVLAIPSSGQSAELTARQLFALASPSVVKIQATRGSKSIQGSGVVLTRSGDDSYVITNAHIAGMGEEVKVTIRGIQMVGKTLVSNERQDLAVVVIKGVKLEGMKYVKAGDADPGVGDRVFAIGSPSGLTNTLSEGLVSGLRQRNGVSLIQTTAAISPGSSGGGLFNKNGKLIGITTFKIVKGENLNFAIDVRQVDALISGDSESRQKTDVEQRQEAKTNLSRIHPDWYEVVNSAEFKKWKATLPKDEEDRLNESWDWQFIAQKITEHKKVLADAKAAFANSRFRLICQQLDYKGNPDEVVFAVDENAQTINGRDAHISPTTISYSIAMKSGGSVEVRISRVTGLITYDDSKYGRQMTGTCKRLSGESAF